MYQAVYTGKLSGNGVFTKKCQQFFEERYGFKKCLLTTSGTDALEMCAMLCDIKAGDEVIVPSYTFVSTALAFLREGATVIFADSMDSNPNLDAEKLESLITPRTKVIVPVHYAGVACDMDTIMAVAEKHNIIVVEDAAQAIDSFYKGKPCGGCGHLGAFSFHETKNITAGGEGGLLTINDERFIRRSEILWEKGTNRAEFFRGAVNKYGWVDMGSSFLPAEINAAFLDFFCSKRQITHVFGLQQIAVLIQQRRCQAAAGAHLERIVAHLHVGCGDAAVFHLHRDGGGRIFASRQKAVEGKMLLVVLTVSLGKNDPLALHPLLDMRTIHSPLASCCSIRALTKSVTPLLGISSSSASFT